MARKKERKYSKNPVCNLKIRALIAGCGIRYGEIAEKCFISSSTLSQWFMHEMKDWQREEVVKAIGEIIWERGIGDEDKEDRESLIRAYMDAYMGSNVDSTHGETVGI